METYSIKAVFANGNIGVYEINDMGVCGAMHQVLSWITEYEEPTSELVSLEVLK